MLPKIVWGGEEFYDISSIVTVDRFTRPGTDGIAFHHTVGQTEFPDKNMNGTSLDEMIEHVKAINAYHIAQNYGGFGYNAIVFRDGTVMTVGKASGGRAHVANENGHLAGVAAAGDFSTIEPPIGIKLGTARFFAACQREYGADPVKGHRDWVTPASLAQGWGTSCPGNAGKLAIGSILMARDAILRKDQEAIEQEIRAAITRALLPATLNADLETLAGQIRFLTGGRLC